MSNVQEPFLSFPARVLQHCQRQPEKLALLYSQGGELQQTNYRVFGENVARFASSLDALGLPQGARVCVLTDKNGIGQVVELEMAAMSLGLVPVVMPPGFSDGLTARLLDHIEGSVLTFSATLEQRAAACRAAAETQPRLVPLGELRSPSEPMPWTDLVARVAARRPDETATLIMTGGSTGVPKQVIKTHENLASRPWAGVPLPVQPDMRCLCTSSLSSTAGKLGVHWPLANGNAAVFPETGELQIGDMQRLSPDYWVTVPRALQALAAKIRRAHDTDAAVDAFRASLGGKLAFATWGGSPLDKETSDFYEERCGVRLLGVYGMTEIGIVSIQTTNRSHENCGRLFAEEVRFSSEMELQVRGTSVTPGYFNNQAATDACLSDDGWWKTGDLLHVEKTGNLVFDGRLAAQFNCSNGVNIDPITLETEFLSSGTIQQIVVVGHRRPFLAAMVYAPDEGQARATIQSVNAGLEPFEQLRAVRFLDKPFPQELYRRAHSGKIGINRGQIDEDYAAMVTEMYEAGPDITTP